jgi:ornithine cyclodeaminase
LPEAGARAILAGMLILTRSDVERLLTYEACIPLMREAMAALSSGLTVLPLRQFMTAPGMAGKMGLMPGYLGDGEGCFGVKVVSKFPRQAGDRHGTHVGFVALFDAAEGLPRLLAEGGSLTAIRTASASAMAADLLARPEASRLLILGAGEEAHRHAQAFAKVRRLSDVAIWARRAERAETLAAALRGEGLPARAAEDRTTDVPNADLIVAATSAEEPILEGRWLRPGQHVTLVGSAIPQTAEADEDVVAGSRFFVDYRVAALAQAGELRRAIASGRVLESHIAGEIGEVILGRVEGRRSAEEITLYKSLGVTCQDLAAARYLAQVAGADAARIDLSA